MAIDNLEARLLALPTDKLQKFKKLREECIDALVKAARLKSGNAGKYHDSILSVIDKIEGDRLMIDATRLDKEMMDLLA